MTHLAPAERTSVISTTTSLGTSSPRGYYGTSSGWLDPRDAFLSRDSIRGWARGGRADRPSTLTTYRGIELIPSWDRCVAALRRIAAAGMQYTTTSWVDTSDGRRISTMLDRPEPEYYDRSPRGYPSASDSALAWVLEHALGMWRFDEAARLAGVEVREERSHPTDIYRMTRTPEEIADAAISGEVVCYRYMETAARFVQPGVRHSSHPLAAHSPPA